MKGSDALLFRVCEDLKFAPTLEVFHTGQEDPDLDEQVDYLGQALLATPDDEVQALSELVGENGMKKARPQEMLWVTKPSYGTGKKVNYVAYGNEAMMMSVYAEICIVVHLKQK